MDRYDVAIIGSGPAGLSAAINAVIRNKKVILFGNENLSNKLLKAPKINNYLGIYDISGIGLKEKFLEHVKHMNIEIKKERVNSIYSMGEYFALSVNEKMYEATSVIMASGVEFSKPLNGEEKLLGRGVGYCATCDAPLYKGKVVTIIGYTKEAEEDANYVSELAEKVYYLPMYKGQVNLKKYIEIIEDKPLEILGDDKVSYLKTYKDKIKTDAVFIIKDSVAPSQLVPGLLMDREHIAVDINMKTNIEGCFAAGDCAGKPYQYMKAAGQGQIAALNAVGYIDKIKLNK
ncbi:NAD(P)/FAD-dependent oxidoreductase [Clostridium felsineum]|uniref:NAD(P)/FAD-dependent oxidoreductase n=1 Tax=Clostridium felsineum TaxID=36839 RepID=UPI00098BEBA9|nr:NAD(P)/FAD-dependent oxidoreductase [Clostridium felsineum]MCR3760657.1 NAD(P)/FAD-dependent oxidoreductase [Clostridium felsineum]URZ00422.1 Thioredoxin reductase [Clostridium felsineum]